MSAVYKMDSSGRQEGTDDDEVVETDPDGRFYRYKDIVGKGRFKQVGIPSLLGIVQQGTRLQGRKLICIP